MASVAVLESEVTEVAADGFDPSASALAWAAAAGGRL